MFPELIDAMADLEKVTEYLHLPVQSGSDSVLQRMLRTYTIDEYRRVVDAIRERIPDIGLATDIIVGFCGESDEEFEATVRLLDEMCYQGAFIFKYSERKSTRAASVYADDVPDDVKKERNQRALKIVERHARRIYAERIGRVEEVLVEGTSKLDRTRLTGRNRRHQIVVFPGDLDEGLVGQLVPVRITESTNVVLVGERVGGGR
jgi:tRNA-2-methylthio-N6-dimethylallyladenosine synthase